MSNNILRSNAYGHGFHLSERGPIGAGPTSLIETINWLDVEKMARYKPQKGLTYCNIYAYDYCCQAEVFLPRVWWMPDAIKKIRSNIEVPIIYAKTVYELNANSLCRWLIQFGDEFLWRRLSGLDDAQGSANNGEVVVACGRRTVESSSGHISIIAPETAAVPAVRVDGRVIRPVQSQAGGACIKLEASGTWWNGKEFAEYGFWANPKPLNIADKV
jgi:hypothetical protein